jgi:hypothetical protein
VPSQALRVPRPPRRLALLNPASTRRREEGVRALYKGYLPKLLRMALGGAVGITSFDFFNAALR